MTEQPPEGAGPSGGGSVPPEEATTTGDRRIDAVLEGLAALDDTEVDDHPGIFAEAHEALREALSAEPDDAAEDG